MSISESLIKNDKESAFPCFVNLYNSAENHNKTFASIILNFKKFLHTSFSISIFNYSIERKVFIVKENLSEEVYNIYRALKYYIKINFANLNYLLKKTEIINKLIVILITEITSQEDLIFEHEKNVKRYKKIIKFIYNLYLILLKLLDANNEDKFLVKSIRQIGNFLVNLNSFRSEFVEKNINTSFIDFIYLGISQISLPNGKSSAIVSEENKIPNNNLCEIKRKDSVESNFGLNENQNLERYFDTTNLVSEKNIFIDAKKLEKNLLVKNLEDISNLDNRSETDIRAANDKYNINLNITNDKMNNNTNTNTNQNEIIFPISKIDNINQMAKSDNLISNKNIFLINKQQISIDKSNNAMSNQEFVKSQNLPQNNFDFQNISASRNIEKELSIKKSEINSLNSSTKINSRFIMYQTKLKNFSKVYFKKDDFIKDIQTTKSKDLYEYYEKLEFLCYNYYINFYESCVKFPKIDEKNFIKLIKKFFGNCNAKLIGAYAMKYLTNLNQNESIVDCLIMIDKSDNNSRKSDEYANSQSFTNFKFSFDKDFVIQTLDKYEDENFLISLNKENIKDFKKYNVLPLLIKSKILESKCSLELLFYNEIYFYSNHMIEKIFNPQQKDFLKDTPGNPNVDWKKIVKLHIFFQEILLNNIQVICLNRFELSLLIISFLDLEYEIFNKEEKGLLDMKSIYFPDINDKNPSEEDYFKVKGGDFYLYKIKQKNFLNVIEKIRLGELIDGFFRYVLSYLTFFKNVHYDKGKNNREFVDGFDVLCQFFKKDTQKHLYDKNYILNHNQMSDKLLNMNQAAFNNRFVKVFKSLANIYFKILENFKSIKDYAEIIFNIEKSV